ncbi:hypothetical protein M9H77_04465 [Catharanthus roseus]|uniref:Uncharacterized protein n=1 Tax=Catharanthus roseus TaxID=4058 RepID=A0ACC0CED6_CATRO|nr:hypothetical protein M9H77_04465 [Catharanthus roseus]
MVPDAVDTRLDLHQIQLRGNDNTSWVTQHAIHVDTLNQWRVHTRDGPAVTVEALGITRVYIGNPANHDTRAHGYQPIGVDRRMEVDDISRVAIQEPPSSPSQIVAVMKKVQTIIWRCMATFPVQPSRRRPREHIPDRGARGVKRGAQRHPGRGTGAGRPPVPPAPQRQEHVDPDPTVVEKGEGSGSGQQYVDPFNSSHLDMSSYSLSLTPDPQSL